MKFEFLLFFNSKNLFSKPRTGKYLTYGGYKVAWITVLGFFIEFKYGFKEKI